MSRIYKTFRKLGISRWQWGDKIKFPYRRILGATEKNSVAKATWRLVLEQLRRM
jgi:hypothetical protein